jgi:hypothetical protein
MPPRDFATARRCSHRIPSPLFEGTPFSQKLLKETKYVYGQIKQTGQVHQTEQANSTKSARQSRLRSSSLRFRRSSLPIADLVSQSLPAIGTVELDTP